MGGREELLLLDSGLCHPSFGGRVEEDSSWGRLWEPSCCCPQAPAPLGVAGFVCWRLPGKNLNVLRALDGINLTHLPAALCLRAWTPGPGSHMACSGHQQSQLANSVATACAGVSAPPGPALGSSGPSPSPCPLPLLPCALWCWQPVIFSELEYRGLKDVTGAQTLGPGEQQDAPLPTLPPGMLLVGCQCVPTHPHVPTPSSLRWGHASSLSAAAAVDTPWLSLALSLPGERLQILGGSDPGAQTPQTVVLTVVPSSPRRWELNPSGPQRRERL